MTDEELSWRDSIEYELAELNRILSYLAAEDIASDKIQMSILDVRHRKDRLLAAKARGYQPRPPQTDEDIQRQNDAVKQHYLYWTQHERN